MGRFVIETIFEKLRREGILNEQRLKKYTYIPTSDEQSKKYIARTFSQVKDVQISDGHKVIVTAGMENVPEGERAGPELFTRLTEAYFPVGRSGYVHLDLDKLHLELIGKSSEKYVHKVKKIEAELKKEKEKGNFLFPYFKT